MPRSDDVPRLHVGRPGPVRAPRDATPSPLRSTMPIPLNLHPDRLFPADAATRDLARRLYATVRDLPIVSPHGHTDPQWFADDTPFANASALLITPDHYVFRMLYSQGVRARRTSAFRAATAETASRTRARSGTVRRALPPVPRHADAHLARPCVPHGVRRRRAPDAGIRRPLLRPASTPASRYRRSGRARCSSASTSR